MYAVFTSKLTARITLHIQQIVALGLGGTRRLGGSRGRVIVDVRPHGHGREPGGARADGKVCSTHRESVSQCAQLIEPQGSGSGGVRYTRAELYMCCIYVSDEESQIKGRRT